MKITLGNRVKDIVTGFEGIATARLEYLNGCVQYCVKPTSKDNAMPEGQYIDIQQLEVVDSGIAVKKKDTGGIMPDSPKGYGLSKA
jgi:ActR/RegA family two-component response regulator